MLNFNYKGYKGIAWYDHKTGVFLGLVQGSKDKIFFSAKKKQDVELSFRSAIDEIRSYEKEILDEF